MSFFWIILWVAGERVLYPVLSADVIPAMQIGKVRVAAKVVPDKLRSVSALTWEVLPLPYQASPYLDRLRESPP